MRAEFAYIIRVLLAGLSHAMRAQGVEFPSASSGYILADAANWSTGQKAAVTRAINEFDFVDDEEPEPEEIERGISDEQAELFFDDSAGDEFEEFDDIDYFDFDEGDEFIGEEGDDYEEDAA